MLAELRGIRAVLFDVYGTLFISGSGEVGTSREAASEVALARAMAAIGIHPLGSLDQGVEHFFKAVARSHAESRKLGIDYPEVDIVEIWQEVLAGLSRRGVLEPAACERADVARLAVEYEARVNPTWPMPGMKACLRALRRKQLVLGIISNAQFYTPELFPALLGDGAEAWGFDRDLQHYSYQHGFAKPGLELCGLAVDGLRDRRIEPGQAVYVGNDLRNDVLPASAVGFHTALFAGDARSLRRHQDDPCLEGMLPQLVLTELRQLPECIIV